MTNKWERIRFGEVLHRTSNTIEPSVDEQYQEITIKLWGKGVIQRGVVSGALVAGTRRFVARAGQFIASRIDARNGAVGIVPANLDGALVSNDFPLFDIDIARLEPAFLSWWSKTEEFVSFCRSASEGTTNRVRLKEERFLNHEIALPPLAEQRRIVARIEELATKVEKISLLQDQIAEQLSALMRGMLQAMGPHAHGGIRISQLMRHRPLDVTVDPQGQYQFAGVFSFGRGVFKSQMRKGSEFAYSKLTRLRAGDFVYPKLMAWEGAFGVVPPACDGCVVSPEFPVFEINRDQILPEVIDVYFQDPLRWDELAGASAGTNVRRRRLHPREFLSHKMSVPPMRTQKQIRAVYNVVRQTQAIRKESAEELGALVPAILNRAFEGKL